MVFLVTFLSINKKVITWRLLVEGSGVYEGLSLVVKLKGPNPYLICRSDRQASVPISKLERGDLSGYSFGII
jgi:hypothetical protein